MIAEKMKNMVANSSAIRAMFEEGNRLAQIYGAENVFDFSLGNPNVAAPESVKNAIVELLNENDPVVLHGYTNSNSGYADVRETVAQSLNELCGEEYRDVSGGGRRIECNFEDASESRRRGDCLCPVFRRVPFIHE